MSGNNFDQFKRKPVKIDTNEPLEYNSVGWEDTDYIRDFSPEDRAITQALNRDHNREFMIFNFGVTMEGNSVCTQIRGYKPYFYIMIPEDYNEQQREDLLTALSADTIIEIEEDMTRDDIGELDKFYAPYYKSAIVQEQIEVVKREIFWKFTNHTKYDFIKLVFHSKAAMKFYYNILTSPIDLSITGMYKKRNKYNLFEADMEPLLRYYHDQNIKPSGWLRLEPGMYSTVKKLARCQIAVTALHNKVIPIEKDAVAPIRVAAFDIEADSSHGDFPVAQKDCKKLANQLVIAWLRDKHIIDKLAADNMKTDPRYTEAKVRQSQGAKFFSDRIRLAVQLPQYIDSVVDEDIEPIYLRGCYSDTYIEHMYGKCHTAAFDLMAKEIYEICNRDIKKIIANKQLKNAIKSVENMEAVHLKRLRPGQSFTIRNYMEIIHRAASNTGLEHPKRLEYKMIDKNQLVRFVNNQLNRFFGKPYGDRVIQIGTVFWKFGDDGPYHNNILTLQGCSSFDVGEDPCDIQSYTYKHNAMANRAEAKLLSAWSQLIRDHDPDIITGYNIHGFDMAFMYDRMLDIICDINSSGCTNNLSWDEKNKIKANIQYQNAINLGKLHPDIVKHCPDMAGKLVNKKLSSSALGDNFLFYFNTPGRVQIDLLKVCQNSMDKLPSYKLDDVASYYISGKITHILPDGLDLNAIISEWSEPNGARDRFLNTGGKDQNKGFSDYLTSRITEIAAKDNITNGTRLLIKGSKEIDEGNFVVINMSTTGQQLYDGDKIPVMDIKRDVAQVPILQKDGSLKQYKLEELDLEKPVPFNCLPSYPMWGLAKDDVSPKDIFRLQKGTNADRAILAKYCIQDCVLLIRLLKKLEVITNNFGMSNVSLIPFSYIFLRGQGIKSFSLVVNECAQAGFVLPTLDKIFPDEEELAEGAHIMAYAEANKANFADGDDGEDDGYNSDDGSDNSDKSKSSSPIKSGNEHFKLKSNFNEIVMSDEGYEGAIVLIPKPGIYFEPITVLDFSSLYPSEMIASDLSHDRIVEDECWLGDDGKARLYELGYDVLDVEYDNLVPVDPKNKGKGKRKAGTKTVRFVQPHNGEKGLLARIQQKLLDARKGTKERMKVELDAFRYILLDGLQLAYKLTGNSLYGQLGAPTSKIYKKEIAASITAGGRRNIYLAKDYCLAKNPGCDVVYGDSVTADTLVYVRVKSRSKKNIINGGRRIFSRFKKTRVYRTPIAALFDKYFDRCKHWPDATGKIHIKLSDLKHPIKTLTSKGWTNIKYIMGHTTMKTIYHIKTNSGEVYVTEDHSCILADGTVCSPKNIRPGVMLKAIRESRLPKCDIVDDDERHGEWLTRCVNITNMCNINPTGDEYSDIINHNEKYNILKYAPIMSNKDSGSNINQRKSKNNKYESTCMVTSVIKCPLTEPIWVYDLETENHEFQAGDGNIVVHNTDSVFVKLNLSYNVEPPAKTTDPAGREYPETKLEKIKRSLEIGLWLQAKLKEDKIFREPHDLEYEKVYYPLILITKKRYIGIKFEFDPEEGKKTSMGVVTKRRDNAPILKHTFIGVVDTLMKERDLYKAVEFVKKTCIDMIDGLFDLNMFVISKTLKEYYKDPESIAHKVLATRMGERDPGNKPTSNTRIPYVYIKIKEKPGVRYLQGDRIEHINYVRENNCTVDYEVYIMNQIMKPISQIFELVVDQLPNYPYTGDEGAHFQMLENVYYEKYKGDLTKTAKKVSKLKQKMIHKLIFQDLITYAINKYTGQKTIADLFANANANANANAKSNSSLSITMLDDSNTTNAIDSLNTPNAKESTFSTINDNKEELKEKDNKKSKVVKRKSVAKQRKKQTTLDMFVKPQ